MNGEIKDHGVVLQVEDIPWAGRQLWDCDVVLKDGRYYMYFPLKDQNDIFRIGVAISDKPEGPFIPQANPMKGSYSIDPAVFDNGDGDFYIYFGGLWGGQLQRYRDNKALECAVLPEGDEQALPARVAKLSKDMLEFAEEPKALIILDENGKPLTSKPVGCISTTVNIIFPTPPVIRIVCATPLAIILTDLSLIKALSLLRLWAGLHTMPS